MKKFPPLRMLLGTALFLALLIAVEYLVGWQAVLGAWQSLPPVQTLIAVMLVLFSYAIRTLRLVYFFPTELRTRFFASLKLILIHNFWNNLLPMRTGEISFPILMQRYFGITPTRSLPALFWFRLLDLYVVMMLVALSLALAGSSPLMTLLLALLLTASIPLLWKSLPRLLHRIEGLPSERIRGVAMQIRQALPTSWGMLALSAQWTLLNWTVKLAVFAWVLMQFVTLEPGLAMLGAIGGELTSVLPVHGFAGAGTYEAGVVVVLLPAGIDAQQALVAAVNLHLFLLSCALLGGLIGLIPGGGTVAGEPVNKAER